MRVGLTSRQSFIWWLQVACGVALVGSAIWAMLVSVRWPLVGDASLMHYIVFLQKQGLTPYRDIIDINMPGTYAFEALAMRCFGPGALGWRLYDLCLVLLAVSGAMTIAGRANRFAGLFAGSLFALIHLQDGLAQGGQRNLLMAVLVLWAYAALFRAQRSASVAMSLVAGLSLGCTLTIKPVLLQLALVLLGMSAWVTHRRGRSPWPVLVAGCVGLVLPVAVAFFWLKRVGVLQDFVQVCTGLLPLHARMGRQTLPFLLGHALSPVPVIAGFWLLLLAIERPRLSAERAELLLGIVGTAVAYIAEGKGYPYQRYPFLALLLVTVGIDITRALRNTGPVRAVAIATCCIGCFLLAPRFCWLVSSFSNQTPFETALSAELTKLGTPQELQGEVQCIDTFGGCVNSLYDLRLRQSTGLLYDCYLFSEPSQTRERYRAAFWAALQRTRPRIVVETDQFCFGDARGFAKLETWPLLADAVAQNYDLQTAWRSSVPQHWWHRKDQPAQFRIYVRKPR